jgi:hypothetical protein
MKQKKPEKIIRIKVKKGEVLRGKTDFGAFRALSDEEVLERAKNDPDAPPCSADMLKKFKPAEDHEKD